MSGCVSSLVIGDQTFVNNNVLMRFKIFVTIAPKIGVPKDTTILY